MTEPIPQPISGRAKRIARLNSSGSRPFRSRIGRPFFFGSSTFQVESWEFADARGSMSVHRRIPDIPQRVAEGRFMTQTGHSACSRVLPEVDLQRLSMIVSI